MKKLKQFLVKKFKESKLVKETIRRLWDSRFFSDLFHIMVIILLILIINTILLIINKIIFLIMKNSDYFDSKNNLFDYENSDYFDNQNNLFDYENHN
jgi:hypothetical protein